MARNLWRLLMRFLECGTTKCLLTELCVALELWWLLAAVSLLRRFVLNVPTLWETFVAAQIETWRFGGGGNLALFVISGFRLRVNEISALLGCYASLVTDISGRYSSPSFKGEASYQSKMRYVTEGRRTSWNGVVTGQTDTVRIT